MSELIILIFFSGVVFKNTTVNFNGPIDPLLIVFSEKAVTPHQVALEKAVAAHRKAHVLGTGGAVRASRAIDRRDDFLVEVDDRFGNSGAERVVGRFFGGSGRF